MSAIPEPPFILMPSRARVARAPSHPCDLGVEMEEFETPDFGVTVLGAADGMSPDDTTAGFVLWMRGRGILVDPARALGLT